MQVKLVENKNLNSSITTVKHRRHFKLRYTLILTRIENPVSKVHVSDKLSFVRCINLLF